MAYATDGLPGAQRRRDCLPEESPSDALSLDPRRMDHLHMSALPQKEYLA